MGTNTTTRNMTDSSGRLTVADDGDHHFIFERDGCRCQVCGAIGHPHKLEDGDQLPYPPHPDNHPDEQIPICGDCFIIHTDDQLDEYVQEMQERQRALEEDPGDYEQNRERAFERDDHTCQLCGQEGYPKTERGLVAYPVCAGDFHLDNLVTICNDCVTDTLDSDEEDQKAADRLRLQAARAKEWINSDDPVPEERDEDGETEA